MFRPLFSKPGKVTLVNCIFIISLNQAAFNFYITDYWDMPTNNNCLITTLDK